MPHDGRNGYNMVKTRLSTVPEILEHLNLQIEGIESTLEKVQKNNFVSLLTLGEHEARLKGQLEALKAFRDMIIC